MKLTLAEINRELKEIEEIMTGLQYAKSQLEQDRVDLLKHWNKKSVSSAVARSMNGRVDNL